MPIGMEFHQGNRHSVTLLDIRLDNNVVILRGTPTEAAGAVLRGSVTVILKESLSVRAIRLKLVAVERVGWHESVNRSRSVKHEKVIYEKDWQFLNFEHDPKKCFVLGAGNYEYPFEHIFPGNAPESVEGLDSAYVVYRMKATIERPTFSHDIHTNKHLRVVRTLSPEDEALSSTMAVENVWPEKCEYSISIPAKACVFGTVIPLNIGIMPLLKGLTIGKVSCTLREFDTFSMPERNSKRQDTRNIQITTHQHGSYENSEDGLERWVMHTNIELPTSLSKCVQDCEVGPIKVRHKLRVSVQLHNPDGHTSELRASLPVQLFISPNHLMDEDNEIHSALSIDHLQDVTAIPPRYDEHMYDRLWDDIPHDYNTPLPSCANTPLASGANTPALLSRNNSSENLTAIGAFTSLSPPNLDLTTRLGRSRSAERLGTSSSSSAISLDRPPAEDLQATLAADENALVASSASTTGHNIAIDSRGRRVGTRSAGNTRPNSPDGTSRANSMPHHHFPILPHTQLDAHALSRVPSYRTAMKPRPRDLGGDISSLPRYDGEGLSRPTTSPPDSPPRSREPSPSRSIVGRIGFTLRSGHTYSRSTGHVGRGHHSFSEMGLRILQARGR
ncbi:hypothetical protein L211DRAFT_23310 [Terfezia boudieri ATCC MYA-4762]|uniref:Arrestin C-terminal-like domain-containing protein n=1 Tax=Terfezia boudieri ATCC MYA-4762 TaxID=1051890 RepID=A0A3N4M2Z6_9PEZI|nr:hypothetical protein L211DRAFT_23310 [Terfezia boudieri ATCC MYA-4762]